MLIQYWHLWTYIRDQNWISIYYVTRKSEDVQHMCWTLNFKMVRNFQSENIENVKDSIWEKSPDHTISVGLSRNIRTRYVSPRFHVLHDDKFQTVMGGYKNNEAISAHVWDSLAQANT